MSILPPSGSVTLAAVPAVEDARHARRIADRPGHDVVEALAHHLLDHAHHVLRAAGGGVVAVVDEDDRALAERPRVGDLAGQRRALVEEGRAPLPRHVEQPVEQGLALRRCAGRRRSTAEQEMCGMSACGKPPNTDALSTAPPASAAIAMSMMSFMGWRDGVCSSVLVIIGREPQTITGADLARRARARSVRPARCGRLAHVDVRVGAVAGDHGGVVDHGARSCARGSRAPPRSAAGAPPRGCGAAARPRRRPRARPPSPRAARGTPRRTRRGPRPRWPRPCPRRPRVLDVARRMGAAPRRGRRSRRPSPAPRGGTRRAGYWCP